MGELTSRSLYLKISVESATRLSRNRETAHSHQTAAGDYPLQPPHLLSSAQVRDCGHKLWRRPRVTYLVQGLLRARTQSSTTILRCEYAWVCRAT